jgi:membrane-bound lytic murein transglycosylase MltF
MWESTIFHSPLITSWRAQPICAFSWTGISPLRRLRAQAEAEGHDPNVWIENVELIAARKIGRETVRYVRNVFKYYVAYRLSVEESDIRQSISIN